MNASLQWVRRAALSVVPRPRRAVTWPAILPLAIFLGLFAGICAGLERSHLVLFARPAALGLAGLAPWVWWMHVAGYAGLGRVRGQVALQVRLLLLGLFAMLLAEPRSVTSSDDMALIYLLDVSDSIGDRSINPALRFIAETATGKPKNDEAGLVIFGRNAAVEFPPRKFVPLEGNSVTLNSLIDREATNLEQGLSLAAAMLPEDKLGKIVLISDGMQTEGELTRVLNDLKARKIPVDVLPIQYDFNDEVWLERLELPQFVKLGETYDAGILLSSLSAGKGTLKLEENGKVIATQEVEFQAGKNRFAIPIYLRGAGYYEYTATIEVPKSRDVIDKNNRVVNSLFLEGEGKILFVFDPQGETRDRQAMMQALRDGQHVVEEMSAYEFPRDPAGLLAYDCIVFVNVPADAFDTVQLQAARDAVFNFGSGFLMVGGANSFGPGGYHRTVIEEALPVTMDITQKKVLPKGALVIVLHTCEFPEGNTWAKRITKQAIKVLGAQDEVGAICYESREKWIFKLTPAAQIEKLARLIEAAEPGDMPSFALTMEMALAELQKSDAATKHVIIISDGDPQPPAPNVLQKYIDNKISVSTVAIFPHGGNEIGLLRQIAMQTGGRYYYPSDSRQLPGIFIKEAKTLKRSMIQNKTVVPEVGMPHGVLRGIEGMPELKGYVITTAKSHPAMTILQVPSEEQEQEGTPTEYDPILAIWQYGIGKTAAFTSDLSPNWAAAWMAWSQYQPFLKQLFTEISRVQKAGKLRMWTYVNGNEGVIGVEDFAEHESFLELQARVSGPQDRSETVNLKQVGPRRYQATVPLWGKGRYHIAASPLGEDRKDDRAFGGFIVPYSPEYLRFRSNPLILDEIVRRTGGAQRDITDTAKDLYPEQREIKRSSQPVFDWFLMALALLVPVDVAVRRVQIDWYVIKGWLGIGVKVASTQTMGALLERKQQVGSLLHSRRGETPLPAAMAKAPTRAARQAAPPAHPPAPAAPPGGAAPPQKPATTTERLLQLKRKRRQDQ